MNWSRHLFYLPCWANGFANVLDHEVVDCSFNDCVRIIFSFDQDLNRVAIEIFQSDGRVDELTRPGTAASRLLEQIENLSIDKHTKPQLIVSSRTAGMGKVETEVQLVNRSCRQENLRRQRRSDSTIDVEAT